MLRIYNTRTNKIDQFEPNDLIGIYTCGPTVYNRVHIGNIRTFFWSDFIVGFLEYLYPKQVLAIMNITDIDDKILKRLPEQTIKELLNFTKEYTDKFFLDMSKMSIMRYHNHYHKVTDNIENIQEIILKLLDKGFAYRNNIDGSIYFDSSKIKDYPFPLFKKESRDISEFENNRNIIRNSGVKDPRDFVLWKVKDNEFIDWDANIGKGRPGWHIECSAIALNHLPNVTIHIGGEDLKFPHHTCEILQSESYDEEKMFGKYWMHIGFLNFNGDKMSKSIGNILYLEDIKENPFLIRYYLFTKHYRKFADFNIDDMLTYKINFINLHIFYNKLKLGLIKYVVDEKYHHDDIFNEMKQNILNDFDTPTAIKKLNSFIDFWLNKHISLKQRNEFIDMLDKMNLLFKIIDNDLINIDNEIMEKLKLKEKYRSDKNFEISDNIRNELKKSYIVEDYHNGVSIIKK